MGQPSDEEVIVIEQTVPASQETLEADYTEAVVPAHARRSNFAILMTFLSMQVVFGAVLVGYGARLGGLTLGELMIAMALAEARHLPMMAPYHAYWERAAETIAAAWRFGGRRRARVKAAIALAFSFDTHRTLTREQQLTDEEAITLLTQLVEAI